MQPIEFVLHASESPQDWFNSVELDVDVTDQSTGTTWRVPAFWAGGNSFRIRFAPPHAGRYAWTARCARGHAPSLDGKTGAFDAATGDALTPLLKHGRLGVVANHTTLRHADGTPFLWLADTWWMAFTKRLTWPGGFTQLLDDRVRKGFNVIQVVLGPLPDYDAPSQAFDPRQADEAGWTWDPQWTRINPAFFDRVDQGLWKLIEHGIVPCIVGMWGYWALAMGEQRARQHWRYLIARYGAWPVTWCIAGETVMPTYHTTFSENSDSITAESQSQREIWSRLTQYVRAIDPWHNLITTHPKAPGASRLDLSPEAAVDFEMVQTTHMGYAGLHGHLETVAQSLDATPLMPVFVSEANYEGIMGSSWADIQRFQFWTSMTMGCCGYTYGAQGVWGMNSKTNPHVGFTGDWGRGYLEDAMHYTGSTHVGVGKSILSRYRWHACRPFMEPAVAMLNRPWSFATGIPGELAIYYLPSNTSDPRHLGIVAPGWMGKCLPIRVAPHTGMIASFIDPVTGQTLAIGEVKPDADGNWTPPRKPSSEDWVLVLERAAGN